MRPVKYANPVSYWNNNIKYFNHLQCQFVSNLELITYNIVVANFLTREFILLHSAEAL